MNVVARVIWVIGMGYLVDRREFRLHFLGPPPEFMIYRQPFPFFSIVIAHNIFDKCKQIYLSHR